MDGLWLWIVALVAFLLKFDLEAFKLYAQGILGG